MCKTRQLIPNRDIDYADRGILQILNHTESAACILNPYNRVVLGCLCSNTCTHEDIKSKYIMFITNNKAKVNFCRSQQ